MNTLKYILAVAVLGVSLSACSTVPSNQQGEIVSQDNTIQRSFSQAPGQLPDDQITNKKVAIETSKGSIVFELLSEDAPLTVSNFIFLASQRFYDGLTFHRVEPGFVIQGGDPVGNGTGGPGYQFSDEQVKRPYSRGIVAMANAGPNTNGSQFFIMLADTPLPPAYTIFGNVTSGMEVVDAIRPGDTITSVRIEDR